MRKDLEKMTTIKMENRFLLRRWNVASNNELF